MTAPRGGRGYIACTPERAKSIVWMVRRGWHVEAAAREHGISGNAVWRQARRDPQLRARLREALRQRGYPGHRTWVAS